MTFCIYGLSKEMKEKLQKMADSKKWSKSQLIIFILEEYFKTKK